MAKAVPGWTVERLAKHHDRADFDCGNPALSDWLRQHAGQSEAKDVTRTYVLVGPGHARISGYYAISACQVRYENLPPHSTKRLPKRMSIPAALLGKLAVERTLHGRGMGGVLLVDALRRIHGLADEIGIRTVVVDAIDDRARAFYLHYGFEPMIGYPDRQFLGVRTIQHLGGSLTG